MPAVRKIDLQAGWLFAVLMVALSSSLAAIDASANTLSQQRAQYAQATKVIGKKNSLASLQQAKSSLVGYPLYPYLEYEILAAQVSSAQKTNIQRFLTRYADTPVASKLRRRWLEHLRGADDWKNFLQSYRDDAGVDKDLACYYQYARYRSGAQQDALAAALEIWQVGKQYPASCDRLFEILAFRGLITEEVAWQRYAAAILSGEYRLGNHIEQFFTSPHYKVLAKRYAALARNPELLADPNLFSRQTPETLLAIEHAINRTAKTDAVKALAHWNRYRQAYGFAPLSQERVTQSLVTGLYQQGHPAVALKYLDDSVAFAGGELLEWRLRLALKDGDWTGIASWIDKIPAQLREEPLWRYWRARAMVMVGNSPADGEAVVAAFRELSTQRNYYGFLASGWANSAYQMQSVPPIGKEQIDRIATLPAMARIRELLYHHERAAAAAEWDFAVKHLGREEVRAAAHVVQRWQWYQQAIMAMAKVNYLDDLEVRFPRPFKTDFEKNARATEVPPNLLFALARQESAFNPSIISPAGARGLMQLMPATAREVARKKGVSPFVANDLDKPAVNVRLGSFYYRQMLDRFDNNRILATAAYNAGPGRVSRWLDETDGKLPFDVWIETIPFKETRNYVQNVLTFSVIYDYHLGTRRKMLDPWETQALL